MKNGPIFFLCLLASLTFSWAGLALASHRQLSAVAPYYDVAEAKAVLAETRLKWICRAIDGVRLRVWITALSSAARSL